MSANTIRSPSALTAPWAAPTEVTMPFVTVHCALAGLPVVIVPAIFWVYVPVTFPLFTVTVARYPYMLPVLSWALISTSV